MFDNSFNPRSPLLVNESCRSSVGEIKFKKFQSTFTIASERIFSTLVKGEKAEQFQSTFTIASERILRPCFRALQSLSLFQSTFTIASERILNAHAHVICDRTFQSTFTIASERIADFFA